MTFSGVGIMRSLNGGFFGPNFLQPFLQGLAGIEPGSPEFEQYLLVAQTLVDSTDGANWAQWVGTPVLANQVVNDDTVPNLVPPLAGSEPMNALLGLASFNSTQMNPDGIRGVSRFLPPALHSALLLPTHPQITAEMQRQMVSFIASRGTAVVVGDPTDRSGRESPVTSAA